MPTTKYLYVIDAGHGGLKNGVYTTDPKTGKLWVYPDGLTIYEGVTNRAIAKKVSNKLTYLEIEHALVYDEVEDVTLGERCRRVNSLVEKAGKHVVFISIHSNAGKGKGFEVFTSIGEDASDICASVFCDEIATDFPDKPLRADKVDGDLDKEANFFVLSTKYNKAVARVLLENLFFDTREEAEFLLSESGQEKIANYISRAIVRIETKIIL